MVKAREIAMESVQIGFRNFEGREGPYNRKGERDFVVFLDDEFARELKASGWNIKWPKPNDHIAAEEDDRQPYLPVAVGFDFYPAKVYLISNNNVTRMDPEEVEMLDWAELENIDLVIRPYEWEVNGQKGIKAYLKAGYFTIVTNAFDEKYGI